MLFEDLFNNTEDPTALRQWITNALVDPATRQGMLDVHGPSGTGKTTLLRAIGLILNVYKYNGKLKDTVYIESEIPPRLSSLVMDKYVDKKLNTVQWIRVGSSPLNYDYTIPIRMNAISELMPIRQLMWDLRQDTAGYIRGLLK